ncbi:MAG: hypothetical protein COA60_003365 [Robiginitomaculum sp.]|nr:hypothetical protein [Robiginitomaculum sp.]
MKRRDVLKIGLGGIASLTPAMALAEYRGPNRAAYENWALLCLRMEKSASYYARLYHQAVNTVSHSGLPFERISRPSQSDVIGNFTEFYYGQPSPVFRTTVYVKGDDPMGYFIAAKLRGWVIKPSYLGADMYDNRFDRNWPVNGHVGAFNSRVSAKGSFDFPFSPGYLAVSFGLDNAAEEWSGGHQITIDEMLVVPGSTLKQMSDPMGFAELFRSMGKSPPPSVLPPAGILRRSIP